MTRLNFISAAVSLAMALPAIALAQAEAPAASPPERSMAAPPTAAPAAETGANPSTGLISADQMPPAQAAALAKGDNKLVSNGPIPDTAANRAKYGAPMSHGGKQTPPVGN